MARIGRIYFKATWIMWNGKLVISQKKQVRMRSCYLYGHVQVSCDKRKHFVEWIAPDDESFMLSGSFS